MEDINEQSYKLNMDERIVHGHFQLPVGEPRKYETAVRVHVIKLYGRS